MRLSRADWFHLIHELLMISLLLPILQLPQQTLNLFLCLSPLYSLSRSCPSEFQRSAKSCNVSSRGHRIQAWRPLRSVQACLTWFVTLR